MPILKALKEVKNVVLTTEDSAMHSFFKNLERCKEFKNTVLKNIPLPKAYLSYSE